MSFWDGHRWVAEERSSPTPSSRRATWAATAVMVLGLVALVVPLVGASARSRYTGTLTASPSTLHAGDYFDVTGCGYDTALGNVIVRFTGGSWGSPLDANGCFTIPHIPALAGDTLSPGVYEVGAYQWVRNRWRETGDTTVTVIP